jgi:hypothetical protein
MPKQKLHEKMLRSAAQNAALSATGSAGVNAALLASGVGTPLVIPSAVLSALGGGAIGATTAYLDHHKEKKQKKASYPLSFEKHFLPEITKLSPQQLTQYSKGIAEALQKNKINNPITGVGSDKLIPTLVENLSQKVETPSQADSLVRGFANKPAPFYAPHINAQFPTKTNLIQGLMDKNPGFTSDNIMRPLSDAVNKPIGDAVRDNFKLPNDVQETVKTDIDKVAHFRSSPRLSQTTRRNVTRDISFDKPVIENNNFDHVRAADALTKNNIATNINMAAKPATELSAIRTPLGTIDTDNLPTALQHVLPHEIAAEGAKWNFPEAKGVIPDNVTLGKTDNAFGLAAKLNYRF